VPTDPISRPWRRLLRFSVRGLIVLVLVVGAALGWIVRDAHVQRDAVLAILAAGGAVRYEWEFSGGKIILGGKPWAPRWLVDRLGVDYFGHVTAVDANHMSTEASDAAIAQVGRLTRVQYLNIHDSPVSDSGLVHLKGLKNLSVLRLYCTLVSDAGLVHLKGLTNLSFLQLEGTQVTDVGVKELSRALPSLRIIR
jgi:hypothetical protein